MNVIHLLLVEDSPDDEKLIIRQFKKSGYECTYQRLENAASLIEALNASEWDIVISDYQMPSFTGIDALRVVKKSNRDIPFIIVSGTIGEETAVEAMREGADDYLLKHDLNRLVPAAERAIREAGSRRQKLHAEKELEETRLHLEGIISSAMDAIITIDESQHIVMFNNAAKQLFGYSAMDVVGKPIDILIPQRFNPIHKQHVDEFALSGRTSRKMGINMTVFGVRSDNSEFPIEASISQVKVRGIKYFTVILRDITIRLSTELQQKQLNAELLRQNEQLQQFGYITSHNIRGPVATMMGLVQLFNTADPADPLNATVIAQLNKPLNKLDMVIRDLNQILDYKAEMNLLREPVLCSETLENVRTELSSFISAAGTEIKADFSAADGIHTVKSYLHSIFHNLLSNAIKYRDTSRPSLVSIHTHLQNGLLCITFADNGLGIDLQKYKGNLFGLYKRFHTHVEGKGLGLHLVKTQVEALSGTISVESQPGAGTTFIITLPLK